MMDTSYSPDLFAGREAEIQYILQVVKGWAVPGRSGTQAILLTGPRGSGKSWLLCELGRRLPISIAIRPLILGEDRPCEETFYLPSSKIRNEPNSWSDFTARILRYLAELLSLSPALPASIDELSEFLVNQYQNSGYRLALLVDGVDELPPEFALNYLEKYVLRPLMEEAGALMVLGGRLPKTTGTWASMALRGAKEVVLPPFDRELAGMQLGKRGLRNLPVWQIVDRGGGYPQTNLILAEALGRGQGWKEALQEAADTLLGSVPQNLRESFWTLCVMVGFNLEEMAELLNKPSVGDWRSLLNKLLATRLVRWEGRERDIEMLPGEKLKVQKEYVMDEAVRRLLEEGFRESDPGRWKELHGRACKLYQDWAGKQRADPRWSQRRDYHCRKA